MCLYVDIYIYGKIILLFIIFNMKPRYTKIKLICQVVTHNTTLLSYVTTTKWMKMPSYTFYKSLPWIYGYFTEIEQFQTFMHQVEYVFVATCMELGGCSVVAQQLIRVQCVHWKG